MFDFDHKMNSWECGEEVKYSFCNEVPDGDICPFGMGSSGAGKARSMTYPSDEMVRWISIEPYDSYLEPAAIIFEDESCRGHSAYILATEGIG